MSSSPQPGAIQTAGPDNFSLKAFDFFRGLQARVCAAFAQLEDSGSFETRAWSRPPEHRLQGGGSMRLMRGSVFEKVGVNVSHV